MARHQAGRENSATISARGKTVPLTRISHRCCTSEVTVRPGKQCPDLVTGKVVRYDTVLSHKRTCFCLLTPAKPEIFNRKIAKVQCATGCKKAGYLTSQLSAPVKRKMTGDMGCNNNIKGFVAKGCFPAIRNKDPGLVRSVTGSPAKHCSVGGDINRGHRAAVLYQGAIWFFHPRNQVQESGRTAADGEGKGRCHPRAVRDAGNHHPRDSVPLP